MRSRYPVLGLVHQADVVRYADAQDTAGGVLPNAGAPTTIYTGVRCRMTVMDAQDEVRLFGSSSGKRWTAVFAYCPKMRFNDFVVLPSGKYKSTRDIIAVPDGQADLKNVTLKLRVNHVKHQVDHAGGTHHTSVTLTLEMGDLPSGGEYPAVT